MPFVACVYSLVGIRRLMPDTQSPTRKRIVDAATRLFYA
ncbi:TetR family transcriptional regulator, partial [Mesorhizobium sp. M7A.F.Ca.CA.001.08.2.1]